MRWTPYEVPLTTFVKMRKERLENQALLNIRTGRLGSSWILQPREERGSSLFETYCQLGTSDGDYLISTLDHEPWTELWQFIPAGEKEVKTIYQIYWLDPYSGIVFGSQIAKRINRDIFTKSTLEIAKRISDSLGKTLSSTIELSHASKKTRQNLERLFQISETSQKEALAIEAIKCVLSSNTYIWRAAKIHKELVKAILHQTDVRQDESQVGEVFKVKTGVLDIKTKVRGARMPKPIKSGPSSPRARKKSQQN